MKKILFLTVFVLISLCTFGQAYSYTYDNAGNRITRKLYVVTVIGSKEIVAITKDIVSSDNTVQSNLSDIISLYPNPVSTELHIDAQLAENKNMRLELFDINGKILVKETIVPPNHVLNLENYANGTYVLRIFIGGDFKTYKIIKE
jgi:hypothetical protein